MTECRLKNINVFYSTFTNVFFLFLSRFYVFNVFYFFFWNVFLHLWFDHRAKLVTISHDRPYLRACRGSEEIFDTLVPCPFGIEGVADH